MKLQKFGVLMFMVTTLIVLAIAGPAHGVGGLCGPTTYPGFYDGLIWVDCDVEVWDCPEYTIHYMVISDCPGYAGVFNYQGLHNGNPSYYEQGEAQPTRIFIVDPEGNVRIVYVG